MRKLLIAATLGVFFLIAPEPARAGVQVSFGIGLPFPPVAVVGPAPCYPRAYYPAPVYYPPPYYGYGPRYRTVRYYAGAPYYGHRRYRRY